MICPKTSTASWSSAWDLTHSFFFRWASRIVHVYARCIFHRGLWCLTTLVSGGYNILQSASTLSPGTWYSPQCCMIVELVKSQAAETRLRRSLKLTYCYLNDSRPTHMSVSDGSSVLQGPACINLIPHPELCNLIQNGRFCKETATHSLLQYKRKILVLADKR